MDHSLDRFVAAQDKVYANVVAELRGGRKVSHWMWFVFPQVDGLGSSAMAQRYAIRSLAEARAYDAHPVLGRRLRDCARLVLQTSAQSAEDIFGDIDARKLRSSMTLFHRAAPEEPIFRQVLDRYFGGITDPATDERLTAGSFRHAPAQEAGDERADGDA